MKFLRSALFISLILLTAACTSSSGVSGQSTNNNYDREFREQTRSSTQNYQQGQQLDEESEGDPIVSLMLVAMETGDVFPGDDYYVYAVADKPRERDDIEYVWSIANGDIHEVEESERGRLETIVETEYATASSGGPAPATTTDQPMGDGMGGGAPASGSGPTSYGPAPQESSPAPRPGDAGNSDWESGGGRSYQGGGGTPAAGGGGSPSPGSEDPVGAGEGYEGKDQVVNPDGTVEVIPGGADGKTGSEKAEKEKAEPEPAGTGDGESEETIGPDEPKKDDDPGEEPEKTEPKKEETGKVGLIFERRVIAGPEDETDDEENVQGHEHEPGTKDDPDDDEPGIEEDLALDVHEAAVRVAGLTTQVRPGQAAETSAIAEASSFGSEDEPVLGEKGNLLRYEYQTWKENGNEKNRRPLAGYGSGRESERLTWEESSEDFEFVTDDPYILWTPEIPGETSIYVQIRYKHDILTDPTELQVTIRLKDPAVSLSEDFPDVVREDEAVYLELNAENIPAFDKGLFTIQFDPIKLSFRDAELGDFFDDSPASSIYFAQPDKSQGKVLLAVDTNSNILDISGDGVLAYIKFKAKEDLSEREETGLMLIADTNARYILNQNGENVLPLPMQNPPFRTGTQMPPTQPGFDRDSTPGTEAPAQDAGVGQAGQNQGGRPGGNTQATTQTYGAGAAAAPAGTPTPATGSPAPTGSGPTTQAPPVYIPDPVQSPPAPTEGGPSGGLSRFGLWTPEGPPYSATAGVGQDSEWLAGKLDGSGPADSQYFFLEEGLVIFTFDLQGTAESSAVLKDINGSSIGRLFSGFSPIGSRGFPIRTAGQYVLEVIADGDWEISAWQPRVDAAPEVRSFKGEMTGATVFTSLPSGLNFFRITHEGTENITITLLNYDGVVVKQLVNADGIYDDGVEYDVPQDGIYLFDIIAYDKWTIEIE